MTIDKQGDKGDNDNDLEDWWTINSLLVSWIRNTLEASLRSTISHEDVAEVLWKDIKDRFSIANGPLVQQLKSDLASCRQKGMTIVDYYAKLKQIWDELSNYEQVATCKHGKCICNLGAILTNKQEEEKVHTFLLGLDENTYATARSNILTQDPLTNMNKVYSILIQEERVKTMTRGKDERQELMAMAVQNRTEYKNKSTSCTNCHKQDMVLKLVLKSMAVRIGGETDPVLKEKEVVMQEEHQTAEEKEEEVEDRNTRMVIGAGKRRDGGLFYFEDIPVVQDWRLFDLEKHEFFVSPDVDFLEDIFPYDNTPIVPDVQVPPINLNDDETEDLDPSFNRKGTSEIPDLGNDESLTSSNNHVTDGSDSPQERMNNEVEETQEEELGRGHRKKKASIRLRDYITHTIHKETPSPSLKPAQSSSSEPSTYYKASKDKRWRLAMNNELQALERNKTWTIEELPKGK
ncbi:retrovirus-related pol polyprotein from transposon TNT 1-94 [Tanacetum coccineum]